MREALIVWGGWAGHEPEQGARVVEGMLEEAGFKVYLENTTEAFADPGIAELSVIVPIFTMSKIELSRRHGRCLPRGGGLPVHGGRPVGRASR
jgi:type 1 glutamine amidotransferase